MKDIRKAFSHSHKFGSRVTAVVESLKLGKATVRFVGSNARLTNLNVVGTGIREGDTISVEYGGISPVVKPLTTVESDIDLSIDTASTVGDEPPWVGGDHGVRVYRSTNTAVPHNTWTTIQFDTPDWDTDNFWTPATPERLTSSVPGFFLIVFQWAMEATGKSDYTEWNALIFQDPLYSPWEPLFQEWKPYTARVIHSNYGEIYKAHMDKSLYDVRTPKDSFMLSTHMAAGDYIYIEVMTDNVYNEARTLLGGTLYPRLTMQFRSYL